MKLIIAGSRNLQVGVIYLAKILIKHRINLRDIKEIISGGATGIDNCGEEFSEWMGIELKVFHAKWNIYGKAAGPIRNNEMAKYADALLIVWNGTSEGSANMKKIMKKLKKPIYEIIIK